MGLEVSVASYKVSGGFFLTGHIFDGELDFSVDFDRLGFFKATLSSTLIPNQFSHVEKVKYTTNTF